MTDRHAGPDHSLLEEAIRDALNHALADGDCRTALHLARVYRGIENRQMPLAA